MRSSEQPIYELLVIDDDPLAIELVTDALESEPFRVCGATNAESAVDFVRQRRPPIVLLDLVMPEVTGLELLERILSIDPGTDVILLTGHYSTDSAVESIQKGAYDYLTKPLPVERLRQKLTKWLEDAHLREEAVRLDHELVQTFQF